MTCAFETSPDGGFVTNTPAWNILENEPTPKPVASDSFFDEKTSVTMQAEVEIIAITNNNNDPALTFALREVIISNIKPVGCEAIVAKGGTQETSLKLHKFNDVWAKTSQRCVALPYASHVSDDGTTSIKDVTGEPITKEGGTVMYQINSVISNDTDAQKVAVEFKTSNTVKIDGKYQVTAKNFTKTYNEFASRLGIQ